MSARVVYCPAGNRLLELSPRQALSDGFFKAAVVVANSIAANLNHGMSKLVRYGMRRTYGIISARSGNLSRVRARESRIINGERRERISVRVSLGATEHAIALAGAERRGPGAGEQGQDRDGYSSRKDHRGGRRGQRTWGSEGFPSSTAGLICDPRREPNFSPVRISSGKLVIVLGIGDT